MLTIEKSMVYQEFTLAIMEKVTNWCSQFVNLITLHNLIQLEIYFGYLASIFATMKI